MSKVFFSYLAAAIVLVTYFGVSSALDCQFVVAKESEGVLNWLGNVTFTVPRTATGGWSIYGTFDQKFTGIGVWVVWGEYDGELGLARWWNRDDNANLTAGQKFTFRFRINYGRDIPPPQLVSLKFENIELCQ